MNVYDIHVRTHVTYEQAWMDTQKEENYTDLLETMIEHNDLSKTPFPKEKLWKSINAIVSEIEDEERDAGRNANKVTTDTFIQPPVTDNTPREETDVENESRIDLNSQTETLKGFKRLTLQLTINFNADVHSNKNVA